MEEKATKKILIIEDDEDSRFLLKYYLKDLNFDVIEASNGQEGIDIAFTKEPDIILLDIMMPVMDGYTASKEIRKKLKDIPIIALTANSVENEKDKSINAGCTDFIEKPIDLNQLAEVINKYTKT
jgi:CheY-like chemotaxis protein